SPWASSRRRSWWKISSPSTRAATSSPARIPPPPSPACSRRATAAKSRSDRSPPPLATARRPPTWPAFTSKRAPTPETAAKDRPRRPHAARLTGGLGISAKKAPGAIFPALSSVGDDDRRTGHVFLVPDHIVAGLIAALDLAPVAQFVAGEGRPVVRAQHERLHAVPVRLGDRHGQIPAVVLPVGHGHLALHR